MIELHGTCKTEFLPLKNELSNSNNKFTNNYTLTDAR